METSPVVDLFNQDAGWIKTYHLSSLWNVWLKTAVFEELPHVFIMSGTPTNKSASHSIILCPSLRLLNPFSNWLCGCSLITSWQRDSASWSGWPHPWHGGRFTACAVRCLSSYRTAEHCVARAAAYPHKPVLDRYISSNLLDDEEGCIHSPPIKIYHPRGTISEENTMTNVGTWAAEWAA